MTALTDEMLLHSPECGLCEEGVAEIERLRAALEVIEAAIICTTDEEWHWQVLDSIRNRCRLELSR